MLNYSTLRAVLEGTHKAWWFDRPNNFCCSLSHDRKQSFNLFQNHAVVRIVPSWPSGLDSHSTFGRIHPVCSVSCTISTSKLFEQRSNISYQERNYLSTKNVRRCGLQLGEQGGVEIHLPRTVNSSHQLRRLWPGLTGSPGRSFPVNIMWRE